MQPAKLISFILGFLLLFAIYHFPEFYSSFTLMAVFKIGFLVIAFTLARVQGWKGLGGYGLGLHSGWISNLLKGLLVGLAFFALSILFSILLNFQKFGSIDPIAAIIKQLPMLLLMTAIPSVAEDILTRGYLYAHLKFLKPLVWILLSSAVYVLNHIWRLGDGPAVLSYLFLLGLVLATAVWITNALWLAFGIHWGANIAFESTNSFVHLKSNVAHEGSTWMLALSWAVLLIILFIRVREKTATPSP